MPDVHHLSQDAHDRLSAELRDLATRGRIEIAEKIEAARKLGDLSENGDYHAAKETQGLMEERIMHLSRILTDAVIIDAGTEDASVALGSTVTVLYDGDDEPERLLLGSVEERADGMVIVSPGSPMGKALLGAGAGDHVEFETPGGTTEKVTVVEVT
ncbi:MAG: transcription elongation factor GreA [Acidimicrobiaceae bacterium]|nr:transcription elongation factor GreA [Acidimicrobiaceae bacterium]